MKLLRLSRRKLLRVVLILILLIGASLVVYVKSARGATRTWDGGCGGDTSWSCDANWSSDTEPVSGDSVVFDNTSDNNSTIDASFTGTVTSISINSGYDGTIIMERSFTTSGAFTQAAGSFDADNQTLDINTNFTLSAGSFTASSGTMTVAANFTVSGSSTFDANGGTLTFDGTGGTIACNSETFNSVIVQKNTATINSDCSLPVGSNPSIGNSGSCGCGTITLQGTLTGSGTLTVTRFARFSVSGASAGISGFDGFTTDTNGSGFTVTNSANFDASSYTTFTPGDFTLSNSATFTAPSGTMTVQTANFTINSGTVFNHNSGTIALGTAGQNGTVACNNATFNLVLINSGPTIGTDCSLPLGTDPTIGSSSCGCGTITLQGVLTGSGTISLRTPTGLTLSGATADLVGFSGISGSGSQNDFALTNSANFNASSFTTFLVESFTLSSSSVFTAPSGNMIIDNGELTINSGTTFNHNNGTLVIGQAGGSGASSCNDTDFYRVNIGGNVTVGSDCTFPLGHNPTIGSSSCFCGTVTIQGVITGSGTIALTTSSGISFSGSSADLVGFSGYSATSTQNTFTVTNGAVIDVSDLTTFSVKNFVLSGASSEFTAPAGAMNVATNFTLSSGTFNANGGTVTLVNSSSQTLSGDITFYNLTVTGGSSKTLTFPASGTITVENALSLRGTSSGSRMLLRSSSSGTQWNIIAEGPGDIVYVNIQDSYACDAHSLVANNSVDNGNNSCWNFATNGAQNPTYIFGGVTFGEGVSITGN